LVMTTFILAGCSTITQFRSSKEEKESVTATISQAKPHITRLSYKTKDIQYIQLTGLKNKEVQSKINAALKQFAQKTYLERERLLASYKEVKKDNPETNPYYLQQSVEVKYLTASRLSVYFQKMDYTGGAHAMVNPVTYNFNLLNGKNVSFAENFKSPRAEQMVKQDVFYYLTTHSEKYFPEIIDEENDIIKEMGSLYYWTKEGLDIMFTPYSVAPFSEGVPTVSIKNELIGRYVQDRDLEDDRQAKKLGLRPYVGTWIYSPGEIGNYQLSLIVLKNGRAEMILNVIQGDVYTTTGKITATFNKKKQASITFTGKKRGAEFNTHERDIKGKATIQLRDQEIVVRISYSSEYSDEELSRTVPDGIFHFKKKSSVPDI
ncbi:DUF3298 and DUF4163 domain-containing protein, partial [Sporolactobacillus sp. CPB3-1]